MFLWGVWGLMVDLGGQRPHPDRHKEVRRDLGREGKVQGKLD